MSENLEADSLCDNSQKIIKKNNQELDENVSVDLEADSLGDLWQSDEFSNLINRVIDVPVAVTKAPKSSKVSDFRCTVTFESSKDY